MTRRMQLHTFACDKATWDAAVLGAAAEGETVSAVLRRLLRERYGRVTADTLPPLPGQTLSEDQS